MDASDRVVIRETRVDVIDQCGGGLELGHGTPKERRRRANFADLQKRCNAWNHQGQRTEKDYNPLYIQDVVTIDQIRLQAIYSQRLAT